MSPGLFDWFRSLPVRGKLTVAFALQLLVLTVGCVSSLIVQGEVASARAWTTHTYEVIDHVERLRAAALAQQSGLRGYILTQGETFIASYHDAGVEFGQTTKSTRELLVDNPVQLQRLDRVDGAMDEWQDAIAARAIEWMSSPDTHHLAVEQTARGEGQRRIDQIRVASLEMIAEERRLLIQREAEQERLENILWGLILAVLVLGWLTGLRMISALHGQIGQPLSQQAALLPRLAAGDRVDVPGIGRRDEIGALAGALDRFGDAARVQLQRDWVRTRAAEIGGALQHCDSEAEFAEVLLRRLAESLGAGYALAYRWTEQTARLEWCAAYGLPDASAMRRQFQLGEGLVGQCMVERRLLELVPVPNGYLRVVSGLGAALPQSLWFVPLIARGETVAVLELAMMRGIEPRHRELLEVLVVTAALAWQSLARSLRTRELLAESQTQAEELKTSEEALRAQQEQLRASNEALRAHTVQLQEQALRLKASEEELRAQSEELRVANATLEERSTTLRQRQEDLEKARVDLQRKAEDLEQASRYKSEFLANMSHELRTPLNSMLILSRVLADNEQGNLDGEQVEAARIVHDSGKSLLTLINDILDLSKVEAGKMQLHLDELAISDVLATLDQRFRPMANERQLEFALELAPELPRTLRTDSARLVQILTNLLSNAFKFTHQGGVSLNVRRDGTRIAFAVRDTGIGIPADHLSRVFQAFEQADSGTSRRYGGTGLGLSIVSGLARLLGGEVQVQSVAGQGSTFTLLLPERLDEAAALPVPEVITRMAPPTVRAPAAAPAPALVALPAAAAPALPAPAGPPALLIVEDDAAFARVLADIASKRGVEVLTASRGREALEIAARRQLAGVLLDLGLPDMSGWEVLERLKGDAYTRNVPVHIISAADETSRGLALGAVGFLVKPASREDILGALDRVGRFASGRHRRLLLVDDEEASRRAVRSLLEGAEVEIVEAADADAGLEALRTSRFDCVILDLGLQGISGFEFLDRANREATAGREMPPVVIYSARELTAEENLRLRQYTESIVIKGARSPERLVDEVALFLHAIRKPGPAPAAPAPNAPLADVAGKTVLVVDDDMRNVFALSKALRARGLIVEMAQDGPKALSLLGVGHTIDLVLMDIMMPGMDGYETMRRIRDKPELRELPIIAVTAKAMKGDREKCLEAGANDYCSKPIDVDQLMSLIRVWV